MAADIRYGDGITISVAAAAVMVEVIGLAEKLLARQNGQPLSPRLQAMRNDLTDCVARAAANADVSTNEVTARAVLAFEKDTTAAAEALGISPSGVRWACRAGRLGRKVGDRWLISDQEIAMYKQQTQGVS
ncbi:hypothetical protein AWC11_27325 [Mycobacterium interjectum]|uniref:helix-turn-helix domain-containing protein n=1 Tax=Mycobacterium terramassiliense TaxID=1841859 RepID=UPI00097D74AB|nr:helix-turn-helix domain-containing protein [Mycobacterium terramassiliense]ORV81060.1 hypothetical protein AWC11_27325 [Mycobacterium interjectum]